MLKKLQIWQPEPGQPDTDLSIQNVQAVWSGTPTLSQLALAKEVMVAGDMLLGEKARCSGTVRRWAREGPADTGRLAAAWAGTHPSICNTGPVILK